MIFESYKIPQNSPEEEFVGTLIDEFYWTGSNHGGILGAFYGFLKTMEEKNVSPEIVEMGQDVYSMVEDLLGKYHGKIYDIVIKRWEELGKPLSTAEHKRRKTAADKRDDEKIER